MRLIGLAGAGVALGIIAGIVGSSLIWVTAGLTLAGSGALTAMNVAGFGDSLITTIRYLSSQKVTRVPPAVIRWWGGTVLVVIGGGWIYFGLSD